MTVFGITRDPKCSWKIAGFHFSIVAFSSIIIQIMLCWIAWVWWQCKNSISSSTYQGVSDRPIQIESGRKKNWHLLELLAKVKWVLACSCSHNFLQVLACSDFRKNSLLCSLSIICILKTKSYTGNTFSRMGNWKTLWKHAHVKNVIEKKFLLLLLRFIETDRPEFSPR